MLITGSFLTTWSSGQCEIRRRITSDPSVRVVLSLSIWRRIPGPVCLGLRTTKTAAKATTFAQATATVPPLCTDVRGATAAEPTPRQVPRLLGVYLFVTMTMMVIPF
jgi:hypothetical protein